MSRDLEEQLNELGPEYREVVSRLRAAYRPLEVERPAGAAHPARIVGWSAAYLVAASLLVLVGLVAIFRAKGPRAVEAAAPVYTVRVTDAASAYRLAEIRNDAAVKEMIRTQNPDGSWRNDFLTRRNAAALANCRDADACIAYKKAMRNLRSRGLL